MNPSVTFISCFLSIFLAAVIFGGETPMDPVTFRYLVGIGVGMIIGLVIVIAMIHMDWAPRAYFARRRAARQRPQLPPLKPIDGPTGPKPGY